MTDHNKLEKTKSKSQRTDKKHQIRSLVTGSIVATLIAITPYLFYLYESVPNTKVWDTFLFTYHSGSYDSAFASFWTIMGKLIPLYLLFIWFFTCRHWWYHVLLIPIGMYVYQLFAIINEDIVIVDEYQLIYLVPLMAIIIPSIYLIRAKMFNRLTNKSMQELEDEFRLGGKKFRFKDYF